MLQDVVQADRVEPAKPGGGFRAEEALDDLQAQAARMRRCLAGGFDPDRVPAPVLCGLQEEARSRSDIQQPAPSRSQEAFQAVQPILLGEFAPLLVLAGKGEEGGLFVLVIGLAIFALEVGRAR
ncbi:MAG: hypothetical protein WDM81_19655 [Rhizomicrobium sp.]